MISPTTEATTSISLKTAPAIPGLTFRKFRGEQDYPYMAEIINSANRADGDKHVETAEEVKRSYQYLQRSDTDKDMLFAEVNGEPIAYGRCMWSLVQEEQDFYLYVFFVHIKGEWRGKGIAHAMGEHLIARLNEIANDHPADTAKKVAAGATSTRPWHQQFAENLGMTVSRYGIEMVRPCSEPIEVQPLPEGIVVRPISPDDYSKVYDAKVEAFRDHPYFIEPTEKDLQYWLENPTFDPTLWKVAWDGDQITGMVLNYIDKQENEENNRKRGYTENISTRRAWRKRGIARALLTQSIQMFQEMGMEETALGVDTENPSGALNLYIDVGYQESKRSMIYERPLQLEKDR